MTTWYDLTEQERAILVGVVLSKDGQRKVSTDTWQTDSFIYLRTTQLITQVAQRSAHVIYTISPQGIRLLLSAPDNADGQRVFPTPDDIKQVKYKLQTQ